MDTIDTLLLDAWNRVSARVRRDRIAALKRSQRRLRPVLAAPMREWCLAIRSCDTRFNPFSSLIQGDDDSGGASPEQVMSEHLPHSLTIDGRLIRRITQPVHIPWPGVTYERAAEICGREWTTMKSWIHQGVFAIEHFPEFKFTRENKRGKDGRERGQAGRNGRPYVWTPSPIDPNNLTGRTPHPVWGTQWQTMWRDFPERHVLTVRREPRWRFRYDRDEPQFRGWEFICPGRLVRALNNLTAEGAAKFMHKPCGRRCWNLYAPLTVWTLPMALGDDMLGDGFDMPEDSGLVGQWMPGLGDPVRDAAIRLGGARSFACRKCWNVRVMCNSNYRGWNDFVSVISGGLLYGHEVPRPIDLCPIARKHRPYTWRKTQEREERERRLHEEADGGEALQA